MIADEISQIADEENIPDSILYGDGHEFQETNEYNWKFKGLNTDNSYGNCDLSYGVSTINKTWNPQLDNKIIKKRQGRMRKINYIATNRKPKEIHKGPKIPEELKYTTFLPQEPVYDRLYKDSKRMDEVFKNMNNYYKWVKYLGLNL